MKKANSFRARSPLLVRHHSEIVRANARHSVRPARTRRIPNLGVTMFALGRMAALAGNLLALLLLAAPLPARGQIFVTQYANGSPAFRLDDKETCSFWRDFVPSKEFSLPLIVFAPRWRIGN